MILLKNKDKKANIKIGNNIEIKDGNDFPFGLTLYGRSTQETRSGKNLFDASKIPSSTGIAVTDNGKTIIMPVITAGNGYTSTSKKLSELCPNLKVGDVVTLRFNRNLGIGKRKIIYLSGVNYIWYATVSLTITQEMLDSIVILYGNTYTEGETEQWILTDFSIMLSSETDTSWEQYGVMPSPDYPSPIESVGRKNIIKSLSSKWSAGINYNLDNSLIKKTMTFSCIIDTSITSANLYIIPATGVSAISLGTINFTANQRATKTFNLTDEQIQVIKSNQGGIFQIYKSSAFESANITDVQLEKGTVATDYVPYEHTEISATVTGKNLISTTIFNANNYISQLLHLKVGNYTIKYTGDISSAIYVRKNDGTTPINGTVVKEKYNINTMTFSISEEGLYYIQFYKSGTGFANFENAQLEEGSTATDYEPYQSNTSSIDLQGNELCSLPNGTKDELVIENGEALLIKRVGKVVLDGSENWVKYQDYLYYYNESFKLSPTTSYVTPDLISDNFTISTFNNLRNNPNIYMSANQLGSPNNQRGVSLYVNDYYSDVSTLKSWLSTHNVEVLYELAEPETINLGTVEMPHTYEGISNITNSADTEMVVKYYKKFEFDKILRSGYNIDEQEYEIAKKQMANGKRKKILSSYVDCIIKIDLGLLDNKTYQEYKEQLEDGEYEYWSYKYNQYKKANFILTKPSITTEYAYDDDIGIDDMEITLEKSSDVS